MNFLDYTEFNNEAAELLEEQSPHKPIIVSYSEIFKYQTCPRQYYYRFILGLKPEEESPAIMTGVKGHKLLQNFHEFLRAGKSKEEALKLTTESAQKLLNKEGFADFSLLSSWTLVDNYIRATDFNAEAIIVENRFLIPASVLDSDPALSDVQIGFTPDVVFRRKGNWLDVEDYKFVQRAWAKKKINRYQQSKLYQIFLERMGYQISRSLIRFFNVKTASITEQAYTLGKREEQTIIEDFMSGVRDVVRYRKQAPHVFKSTPRTMNYTACGFCAFEFVCSLEAEGKDATKTIQSQFVKSDYNYNS